MNMWKKIRERKAIIPHPMNAYILNFILSPEKVSTTSMYRYNPEKERREKNNLKEISLHKWSTHSKTYGIKY